MRTKSEPRFGARKRKLKSRRYEDDFAPFVPNIEFTENEASSGRRLLPLEPGRGLIDHLGFASSGVIFVNFGAMYFFSNVNVVFDADADSDP